MISLFFKRICAGLFFTLIVCQCKAQTSYVDSLNRCLAAARTDTSRLQTLFHLIDHETAINIDSAYFLVSTAEDLAAKQTNKKWIAQTYLEKGFMFYREAIYDLALDYFLRGNDIFSGLNNQPGISDACNGIGLVYKSKKKFKESLIYFTRSLQIRTRMKDVSRISATLNHIGAIYEQTQNYPVALSYYFKSYRLDSIHYDAESLCISAFNIGFVYDQIGQHKNAMKKYQESLKISLARSDQWRIADSYYYIALSEDQNHQIGEAFNYLNKSKNLAIGINAKELLRRIHKLMAALYTERGDFKKANENLSAYLRDYDVENDMIADRSIEDLQKRYDLKNKEAAMERNRVIQEGRLLSKDKILKEQRIIIFATILILILALSLAFLLMKNQNQKQKSLLKLTRLNYRVKLLNENLESKVEERTKELSETREHIYQLKLEQIRKEERIKTELNKQIAQAEMKALRAQMNPHFIFNCLNSINRYIIKNDQIKASAYLSKFARLMRLILTNSKQSLICLQDELESIKLYIELEQLRFENKFSYSVRIDKDLPLEKLMIPPMILQPYIENSIWHGFMHKEAQGNLKISFLRKKNLLIFRVEDDGIGRKHAQEIKLKNEFNSKSLGLKISEERLALLNNSQHLQAFVNITDLYNEKGEASGTRVELQIPDNLGLD